MTDRLPPHARPTPQDYVSGRASRALPVEQPGGDPWRCSFCGCANWGVDISRHVAGMGRARRRVCRNCHRPMFGARGTNTVEVPVPAGHRVVVVPDEIAALPDEIPTEAAGVDDASREPPASLPAAGEPSPPAYETQRQRDERTRHGAPPTPPKPTTPAAETQPAPAKTKPRRGAKKKK